MKIPLRKKTMPTPEMPSDKEIAAQVAKTLGFSEKVPETPEELRAPVSLSAAEKRARREKNRARARRRSQRPSKPHGRQ
jgi:hypothetical protein